MSELILFASQFVTVCLLVVQSQNNVHGRAALAAVTSIAIGAAQIATFKLLPSAGWSDMIAWVAAGPAGNTAAQWIKRHDIAHIKALRSKQ